MSWFCNLCETVNTDDVVECEVCGGISPILSYFTYKYQDNVYAELKWEAVNANEIEALYNGQRHKLNCPMSIVAIIVKNKVAKRTYTFGIKYKK